MTQPPQQQRQANKPSESDHDYSENRITPEFRIICAMQHRGGYHDHFDTDCRQRQD